LQSDPKSKKFTNENIVLEQVRDVLKAIQIPEDVLSQILVHLKNTHEAEKAFHHETIKSLHNESKKLDKKLDDLLELLLDKSITKTMYDRKHSQLVNRRQEINNLLEQHHSGREKFKMSVATLVTLASKAPELFDRSNTEEKCQLMGYVFSNLELNGAKLQYSLKKLLDMFVSLGSYQEWLPRIKSGVARDDILYVYNYRTYENFS
jgi:site-specific DNA recombinase